MGAEGFTHMMELLLLMGKQPRFRVYCIGNEACMGNNLYYRDLALATGGSFVSVGSETNSSARRLSVASFAEEVNAPFLERQERASKAQNQYQVLLLEGSATKYDRAETMRSTEGSSARAALENQDAQ